MTQLPAHRSRQVRRSSYSVVSRSAGGLLLAAALALSGCKTRPAPVDDERLAATVQSQLAGDNALAGQSIGATSQGGVVTLNGTVANDAQRTLAARDAAGVAGVARVVDAITVAPGSATATTTPPAPIPTAPVRIPATAAPAAAPTPRERRQEELAGRAQQAQTTQAAPVVREQPQPAPSQGQLAAAAPPLPPPPEPVFRSVSLAAGTTIPVRMTQTLDSASTQAGTTFSGVVASDIMAGDLVAIPAGSAVTGLVSNVQDATHFKGASMLTVTLSTITRRGEHLAVTSDPYSVQGKGRGTNTAEKVGGGAAVGAILGGILGGGRGAAIGAAAGGGTGAGVNAVTRGQQVQIESETVVRFHLADSLAVRVRTDAAGTRDDHRDNGDPTLVHHSQ